MKFMNVVISTPTSNKKCLLKHTFTYFIDQNLSSNWLPKQQRVDEMIFCTEGLSKSIHEQWVEITIPIHLTLVVWSSRW